MRKKFIYWLANILGVDMMASVRPNNGIDIISHEHKVVNVCHSYKIPLGDMVGLEDAWLMEDAVAMMSIHITPLIHKEVDHSPGKVFLTLKAVKDD